MKTNKGFAPILIILILVAVVGIGLYAEKQTRIKENKIPPVVKEKEPNVPIKIFDQVKEKPLIVDFFACGDYCPGPREKYIVKVYKDITDPEKCKTLGGTPSSFTGWTTVNFCLVQSLPVVNNQEPQMIVLSPNGGETYKIGSSLNIKWDYSNLLSREFNICLYTDKDGCFIPVSNYVPFGSKNFNWIIDNTVPPGDYKITVIGTAGFDNSVYDRSDNYFTITN